jgi:hypothetical protein
MNFNKYKLVKSDQNQKTRDFTNNHLVNTNHLNNYNKNSFHSKSTFVNKNVYSKTNNNTSLINKNLQSSNVLDQLLKKCQQIGNEKESETMETTKTVMKPTLTVKPEINTQNSSHIINKTKNSSDYKPQFNKQSMKWSNSTMHIKKESQLEKTSSKLDDLLKRCNEIGTQSSVSLESVATTSTQKLTSQVNNEKKLSTQISIPFQQSKNTFPLQNQYKKINNYKIEKNTFSSLNSFYSKSASSHIQLTKASKTIKKRSKNTRFTLVNNNNHINNSKHSIEFDINKIFGRQVNDLSHNKFKFISGNGRHSFTVPIKTPFISLMKLSNINNKYSLNKTKTTFHSSISTLPRLHSRFFIKYSLNNKLKNIDNKVEIRNIYKTSRNDKLSLFKRGQYKIDHSKGQTSKTSAINQYKLNNNKRKRIDSGLNLNSLLSAKYFTIIILKLNLIHLKLNLFIL